MQPASILFTAVCSLFRGLRGLPLLLAVRSLHLLSASEISVGFSTAPWTYNAQHRESVMLDATRQARPKTILGWLLLRTYGYELQKY
jgi:hypothetical protein